MPILAIVLGLIAGIVLIGLILLLVWKLLAMLYDRREYAAFEQERLMAKWDTVSTQVRLTNAGGTVPMKWRTRIISVLRRTEVLEHSYRCHGVDSQ